MSRTFDSMFENSSAETKTTTEKGFVESFAKQIGDIGAIMVAISSTVLFMFGLVAASTMAQSVRERTSELAVLKTLGFTGAGDSRAGPRRVAVHHVSRRRAGPWPGLAVRAARRSDRRHARRSSCCRRATSLLGVALMVGMGLLAGVVPAMAAMQLKITDALRRN